MLEHIRECLHALLYYYLLLCECIQITIIIMELQREIFGKYKSYPVGEKKVILEETKASSTLFVMINGL